MNTTWYLFCLSGLLLIGIWDFIKKIITQKWYDKDVFLAVCFLLYVILFGIYFIFFGDGSITQDEFFIAAPAGIFDFMIPLGMMASLKYNDSSLAFVSIRLISSFTLLAIWSFFFSDNLNMINIIGFILGILAIYLLSGFHFWENYKNSKKGTLAIMITIIGLTLSMSYFKYFVAEVDIPGYMFIKFSITALCLFLYFTFRNRWKNFSLKNIKKVSPYALLTTGFFLLHFLYILPNMFLLWPLSLSYKILSYSLAIPIILSVIFYKEKLTQTRIIAFGLTILSLLFFFF